MEHAFERFSRRKRVPLAPDYGVLLAGLAARQTASATSIAQAALDARAPDRGPTTLPMIALFAAADLRSRPPCGTFNSRVAEMLIGAKPT